MGTRNFGFSSQHRLESSFLIEWSQTCYIFPSIYWQGKSEEFA
jgi:hypothetical protein